MSVPRKEDVCKAVAKALSQYGECIDIPADLTRINEVDRLASEIEKERASTTKYGSRQKLTLLIRADE